LRDLKRASQRRDKCRLGFVQIQFEANHGAHFHARLFGEHLARPLKPRPRGLAFNWSQHAGKDKPIRGKISILLN